MNHHIRALRPAQWSKGLLVLAAPVAAGTSLASAEITNLLYTLLAFTAGSSAVYVMNDVRDRSSDRRHPEKQHRPIASGAVSSRAAIIMAVLALVLSVRLSSLVRGEVLLLLLTYVVLNVLYSFGAKGVPVVEMFIVASGFIVRLVAGSVASSIPVSTWLFVCTGCGSLMVVTGKRLAEKTLNSGTARKVLDAYSARFLSIAIRLLGVVLVASYLGWLIWGADSANDAQFVLRLVSAFAVSFITWRYVRIAKKKIAETPEMLIVGDRPIALAALIWFMAFVGANLLA